MMAADHTHVDDCIAHLSHDRFGQPGDMLIVYHRCDVCGRQFGYEYDLLGGPTPVEHIEGARE